MKKFDVTVFAMENNTWTELTDEIGDIIEANDEAEALSVAEDILIEKGYTADEIEELDLRAREIEE